MKKLMIFLMLVLLVGMLSFISANNWCKGYDVDRDGDVDNSDWETVRSHLGETGCSVSNSWCGKMDIDKDGEVRTNDWREVYNNVGMEGCVECIDECQRGNMCINETNYRVCGDFDSDSCLEWRDAIPCEEGFVCSNGECVNLSNPNICTDSDGGENYYVQGSLSYSHCQTAPCGAWIDSCKNTTTLFEYFCDGNNANDNFVYYDCPNGCENGACIEENQEQEQTCNPKCYCGMKEIEYSICIRSDCSSMHIPCENGCDNAIGKCRIQENPEVSEKVTCFFYEF